MIQEWKPDLLDKLYAFSLCILVYAVAEVSWLYPVPRPLLYFLVCGLAIIKMMKNGISVNVKKFFWIFVWILFNMMNIITHHSSLDTFFHRIILTFIIMSVLFLTVDEMKYLLKALTVCFVVILIVSIPAWILYLLGFPLPYTGPHYHPNGYHIYYDYFFFTADAKVYSTDYNRFSSVFLEPGQMATPCLFLFHLNTRDGKLFRFKNIVLLVGIVLSYSLVGYVLLIASLMVNQLQRSKNRFPMVVMMLLVLGGLSMYFASHEDNAINELIVSRLEYDEETVISGYNRTSEDFDIHYNNFVGTSNIYFGIHDGDDLSWTKYASGYKKYIVHNGIVGLSMLMLLMLMLFWDNNNRSALIFIIIVIVAFFVRDLLTSPLWLTITIIGMYILGEEKGQSTIPKLEPVIEVVK